MRRFLSGSVVVLIALAAVLGGAPSVHAASTSCAPWQSNMAPSGQGGGILLSSQWGPGGNNWDAYGSPLSFSACASACVAKANEIGRSVGCLYNETEHQQAVGDPAFPGGGWGFDQYNDTCLYTVPGTPLVSSPYFYTCSGNWCSGQFYTSGSITKQTSTSHGALCTYTPDLTPAPTATLSASPSTINQGQSSRLSWRSTNASSCTGSNFSTGGAASGDVNVSPNSSTNYVVTCTGPGGQAANQASVTVNNPPPPPSCTPSSACAPNTCSGNTCSDSCGNSYQGTKSYPSCALNQGAPCTSSPNSCGMKGTGTIGCNGVCSASTPSNSLCSSCALNQGAPCTSSPNSCGQTNTGTIQCNGSCTALTPSNAGCPGTPGGGGPGGGSPGGGSTGDDDDDTPTLPPVSALLSASPLSIVRGASSILTWISSNAVSCTGGSFLTGGATSGTKQVTPLQTTFYTLTCNDSAGKKAFSTANVTVTAPSVSITASPALVRAGDSSTITWSVQGKVDSCSVSGPGLSSSATSGSKSVKIVAESSFTFSCDAGPFAPSKTIKVKVLPGFTEI